MSLADIDGRNIQAEKTVKKKKKKGLVVIKMYCCVESIPKSRRTQRKMVSNEIHEFKGQGG